MPAISLKNIAAGTTNALAGNTFEQLDGPALVSVYGSTAVAGGTISMGVEGGSRLILSAAEPNIEGSADVVDTDRDMLIEREPVGKGKLQLSVAAQVCNVLIVIEEVG